YPPSGSILMPYSVPPRRVDQSVLPNPTKYWETLTLNSFAGTRWPSSCNAMDRISPTATISTPTQKSMTPPAYVAFLTATWARWRAQASAASTAGRVSSVLARRTASPRGPACSSLTCATTSVMAGKVSPPAWKAATHTSFAALYTAGWVPPARPAARASRTAGNASSSSGRNSQVVARDQSQGAATPGSRSGQDSPSAIGTSIRGGPAWAMVDPSWNSTMEWICCCGCTTTSMSWYGTSNSRCASITSRPLFTRVAELVVTTVPVVKFGCANAWAGVTAASSARLRPRDGPPEAVSTRRRTSALRPERRHGAIALCA